MNITTADLLTHAKECIARNPDMTGRELQAVLEAYYLQSTHSMPDFSALLATLPRVPVVGAINNPIDWLTGGALILKAAAKIIVTKKIDGQSAADVIAGVIQIVKPNSGGESNKGK